MAKSNPSFPFYPGDWRKDPGVQALDYESRGIWFEILLLMHESEDRGKLTLNGQPMPEEALARVLGVDQAKLKQTLSKLLAYGVASIEQSTSTIYNRRMVKESLYYGHLREVRSKAGKKGASKRLAKCELDPSKNRLLSSSSSSSSSSLSLKEKDPTVIDTGAGTPIGDACTLTEKWPKDLLRIKETLERLGVNYNGFYDPSFWRSIDEWIESTGLSIYYLDELKAYLAHQSSKRLGSKGKHKDLRAGFRNWLAKAVYWRESDAQRKAIRQRGNG